MQSEKCEHLLEHAYLLLDEKSDSVRELKESSAHHFDNGYEEAFEVIKELSLIKIDGDKFRLTEGGTKKARQILRRHRLAERLLSDVFRIAEEEMESQACKFEHILSPEVADSICSFLGHPPHCPHGKEIPRGACCKRFTKEIQPVVMPLDRLPVGTWGKIMFTTPAYHKRYERLTLLGVTPGALIRLYQRQPSYVVKVGETEIALDKDIASEIFVRPVKDPSMILE